MTVKREIYAEQIGQQKLFDVAPDWEDTWKGMPAFRQEDQMPIQSVLVHFRTTQDREDFAALLGQQVHETTKSVWYPKAALSPLARKVFVAESAIQPRYPIYIISKGRWSTALTARALEASNTNYSIVIEPQEYAEYAAVIESDKILVLPFSNLGQGSIPARNWVWEHAVAQGVERHWILDDNIDGFCRLTRNDKRPGDASALLCAMESFVDRYENVALAGPNYRFFAKQKQHIPPFLLNTRVYSCILIRNNLICRWRGRYNEDTDLSLRVLKDGECTILFNAFLANKMATLTMRGGNTDELYQGDGRLKMAQSLQEQHPDVVTITEKFGRYQHQVNYKPFRRNKLIMKPGIVIPEGHDEYGMLLQEGQ